MREIPIEVLFSFPQPNYENPETRGPGLMITIGIFTTLVTIAIILRYYTRIALKRWYGLDDVFIGLAYITTIGLTTSVVLANLRYGWNRHVWDVAIPMITPSMKIAMAAKVLFLVAATCTRMSLICFYNRLLGGTNTRWFAYALWASAAFVLSLGLVSILTSIFLCNPVKAYWVFPPMKKGEYTCIDEGITGVWLGGFNTLADLLITLLPIPVILKLQMPRRQRIGVVILLSLGLVVTIAGALRTYYLWYDLVDSYDVTWLSYPLWISATVEIYLGLICACVPAIRPLLVSIFSPSIRSLGSYVKSFVSSAATRRTHSSSSTSKLKTADSSKSYQCYNDAKLTGVTIHEHQLGAVDDTLTTPITPKTNTTFSERDTVTNSDDGRHNKLRIEMQQTVELTTLCLTPEEQARAQHHRILPASLRSDAEAAVVPEITPTTMASTCPALPSASATATTTVTASATATAAEESATEGTLPNKNGSDNHNHDKHHLDNRQHRPKQSRSREGLAALQAFYARGGSSSIAEASKT